MTERKLILKRLFRLSAGLLLIAIFFLSSRATVQRMAAFGCFDQCFNYTAAYFMLKGKTLYSQIFFNHQPFMAYLSYLIQLVFKPKSLFELVLYHRRFIFYFSLLMDLLIVFRFRWAGFGFVLFYELTKYYLFGQFFLAEAVVAYLLVWLLGLAWEKTADKKKSLSKKDFFLATIFTWLILFFRITFAPAAFFLYAIILWRKKNERSFPSVFGCLFIFLTGTTLLFLPLKSYFFETLKVNWQVLADNQTGLSFFLKPFFYPFEIFFNRNNWNHFRLTMAGLNLVWLTAAGLMVFNFKKIKLMGIVFLVLGLTAFRAADPGKIFYEAFHLLPWYALFLITLFLSLKSVLETKKTGKWSRFLLVWLGAIFLYSVLPRHSFVWEKIDRQEEWNIHYVHYWLYGEAVKRLSSPGDTLFLDQWDDLIYWQADLDSPYPYSLYTPIMTYFSEFNRARERMFKDNPPDFYYAYCDDKTEFSPLLPENSRKAYLQLRAGDKPTCLYLKKTKLLKITEDQQRAIKDLGFFLPETAD